MVKFLRISIGLLPKKAGLVLVWAEDVVAVLFIGLTLLTSNTGISGALEELFLPIGSKGSSLSIYSTPPDSKDFFSNPW